MSRAKNDVMRFARGGRSGRGLSVSAKEKHFFIPNEDFHRDSKENKRIEVRNQTEQKFFERNHGIGGIHSITGRNDVFQLSKKQFKRLENQLKDDYKNDTTASVRVRGRVGEKSNLTHNAVVFPKQSIKITLQRNNTHSPWNHYDSWKPRPGRSSRSHRDSSDSESSY